MKVKELIVLLEKEDPDAEVVYPLDEDDNFGADVEEIYGWSRRVGIATDHPRDEAVVWLRA